MAEALTWPAPATAVLATLVRERLPAEFSDVWVGTKIPNPTHPRMVRVSRTAGGGMATHGQTDHVYALFECWADDEDGAEELANVVRAVLKSSPGHWAHDTFIRWWKENSGPYSWPDASDQVRFQFTGEILLKI